MQRLQVDPHQLKFLLLVDPETIQDCVDLVHLLSHCRQPVDLIADSSNGKRRQPIL
jgi:hypothetical protein